MRWKLLHFSCSIGDRRDAVVSRRQKVKALSAERAAKLQASLAWQQFNRDADEVGQSIVQWGILRCLTWYVLHSIN